MGLRKSVVVDTNFILTCIRQKIDLFDWLKINGFQIIVPIEVINELKMLGGRGNNNLSLEAKLALRLLKREKFKLIDLEGDSADKIIIRYANKNPHIVVATLDREMKKKMKNKKITIRRGKTLEIV